MRKRTKEQALKRMEDSRTAVIKAMEEAVELAVETQPKSNLRNVSYYSAYYRGARKAFMIMGDKDSPYNMMMGRSKAEDKVYREALHSLIKKDIRFTAMFMNGLPVRFCNFEYNKKGKLVKCEACFYDELDWQGK